MRILIAVGLSLVLSSIAWAGSCPTLIRQIDTQLESAQLDSSTRQKIVALRNEGEAMHQQGKHQQSVQTLNEALELFRTAGAD
ncbi:hypothetical protein [Marinobacter sp. SS21]|uniref:hypothetical protein n=1 Tax=Marinobacter sp. SS21 TaxID=2979460 RepID=UPI00232B9858|nr:hypothetical protein [Marinobacter sp. SS21]MDC0661538.1 hypothetical protein [Marinobacter sp. SS21]